jgi:type II secretory pathway pseudopilin PulG
MDESSANLVAMKTEHRKNGGFAVGEWIGVIVILAALLAMLLPATMKSSKASERTEALNNIRQLGTALFEFDRDYGSLPDDKTALDVIKKYPDTKMKLRGDFSNDYFRQLIANGLKTEKPFWCKTSFSPKKPDDVFDPPAKALEAGEVGFSYVMRTQTDGQSSSGDPNRPVVIAPSYEGRTDWTFDPKPYHEKAIVLRLDNSATAMQVRTDNRYVTIGSGRKLQDTGENTPWGVDINPVLRAPQPRGR